MISLRISTYIHQNQTHNQFDFKWQVVCQNISEKVLVSLKYIIIILTIFIKSSLERTVYSGISGFSYNNITTLQTTLSPTSLNDRFYLLTYIIYHTDNPLNVRCHIKFYQTRESLQSDTHDHVIRPMIK